MIKDLSKNTQDRGGTLMENIEPYNRLPKGVISYKSFCNYLDGLLQQPATKNSFLKEKTKIYRSLRQQAEMADNHQIKHSEFLQYADEIISYKFDKRENHFHLYMHPISGDTLHISNKLSALYNDKIAKETFLRKLNEFFDEPLFLQKLAYQAIWKKYYNVFCPLIGENILSVNYKDGTGNRYYKLDVDYNYVEISNANTDIAQLIGEADEIAINHEDLLKNLIVKLPLHHFTFSGFKLITITDITISHIKDIISRQVVLAEDQQESIACQKEVIQALEMVTECCDLEFGLYPMLKVNDIYVFNDPRKGESYFTQTVSSDEQRHTLYDYLETTYRKQPQKIFFPEIPEDKASQYDYLRLLKEKNVSGFLLMPVMYQRNLVGVLEVFSKKPGLLTNTIISRLETFFPVLAILFKKSIERFEQVLNDIIRGKFTSLQPAVQWKFNEVAWKYLKQNRGVYDEMEEINFNGVYPLYGAIDIRNSTVNRNVALRDDFLFQFSLLCEIIEEIRNRTSIALIDEKLFMCQIWLDRIKNDDAVIQGGELNYFLENDIPTFLNGLAIGDLGVGKIVDGYFASINDENGQCHTRRRMLEKSMNNVIKIINEEVEMLHVQSTRDYPCFFEKFRTDGVEYDIYIGQSIAPSIPFDSLYIQNLRLLQLTSMISIAHRLNLGQKELPVPVEITQLIFVHPYNIDIRFRRDERRFDVEGAYNIRYHILKKRIDKVHIKETGERLTVPGKIALVYFNQKDADEFIIHIRFLAQKGLLSEDIEFLELESLQGVSGLMALRVTVNFPPDFI